MSEHDGADMTELRRVFQGFIDASVPAGQRTCAFTIDDAGYYRVTPGQWQQLMAMAPPDIQALNTGEYGDTGVRTADIETARTPDAAIAMVRAAGHSTSVARHAVRQATREGASITGEHLVWKDPDSPGRPGSYHLRRVRFDDPEYRAYLEGDLDAPGHYDGNAAVAELRRLGYDSELTNLAVAEAMRDGQSHRPRDHAVFALYHPGSGAFTVLRKKIVPPEEIPAGPPAHTADENCVIRPLHDPCHTGCSEDGRAEAGEILADVLSAWRAQIAGRPASLARHAGLISGRVLADVQAEATIAHAQRGDQSMYGERYTSAERLSILAEENAEVSEAAIEWAADLLVRAGLLSAQAGRIARELNDDIQADGSNGPGVGEGRPAHLYGELIQTAAMAATWAQRLRVLLDTTGLAGEDTP